MNDRDHRQIKSLSKSKLIKSIRIVAGHICNYKAIVFKVINNTVVDILNTLLACLLVASPGEPIAVTTKQVLSDINTNPIRFYFIIPNNDRELNNKEVRKWNLNDFRNNNIERRNQNGEFKYRNQNF